MPVDPYSPPKAEHPSVKVLAEHFQSNAFFGFRGRITRRVFWLYSISTFLALGLLVGAVDLFFPPSYPEHPATIPTVPNPIGVALSCLVAIPATWIALALQVKRWHDHSKSAWWLLIWLTPLGLLWVLIELGLVRGSPYPNKYGPDPLRMKKSS